MKHIEFTWDNSKESVNRRKHGISFEEAKSVFYDDNAFLFFDEEHSIDEERYIMLGLSANLRILIVCHCYIEKNRIIRIFSARKATSNESKYYTGEK